MANGILILKIKLVGVWVLLVQSFTAQGKRTGLSQMRTPVLMLVVGEPVYAARTTKLLRLLRT